MPALKKQFMPRVRREIVDADYLHTLSPEDLAWYHQFISESVQATIPKRKNKSLHPKRLHKSKEEIRQIYKENNLRNNDLYGVTKANGLLFDLSHLTEDKQFHNHELWEEVMIALIDEKENLLLEELEVSDNEREDGAD